jgi:hypothetical protein
MFVFPFPKKKRMGFPAHPLSQRPLSRRLLQRIGGFLKQQTLVTAAAKRTLSDFWFSFLLASIAFSSFFALKR